MCLYWGVGIAFRLDAAAIGYFHPRLSFLDLLHQHLYRQQDVQRLEAGDHAGYAIIAWDERVRPGAGGGADMPGADDAVYLELTQVEQRLHDGRAQLQQAEHMEIVYFICLRLEYRS